MRRYPTLFVFALARSVIAPNLTSLSIPTEVRRLYEPAIAQNEAGVRHRLSSDLNAVSVWIERYALVVAISGATGPVKNSVSIPTKALRQLVNALFGADGKRQVR